MQAFRHVAVVFNIISFDLLVSVYGVTKAGLNFLTGVYNAIMIFSTIFVESNEKPWIPSRSYKTTKE